MVERLGDRVKDWATLNEPLRSAWIGHLEGRMAPGLTDLTAAVRASCHLHLGHGLAVRAIREASSDARVRIVNNLSPIEPPSTSALVHVDYATQRRTVKSSGRRYAELVREHAEQSARPAA